ncbi:MAG: competence/damage-inducible protein A [Lachnospiraceae bacterium]|nr:competence/damage-inducible protein A [Lachnospiraceae bacterium]
MTVEMIFVGTELLLGNIVNTNAAFLSQQCAALGLACYNQCVVGDNAQRLEEALKLAISRADIVLLSGGLGPTQDDLTKETVAAVCGKKLVEDEAEKEYIREYFEKNHREITENNWKQALVPEGAKAVHNPNGTAPGIIIEHDKTTIVLMPGPPGELEPMFRDSIAPYLDALTPGTIVSRMVKICGVGESKAETMAEDLINGQTNPTIATYAKVGEVHFRVTARAEDEKEGRRLIKPLVKELKSRFGADIYTTEPDITLEQAVVDLLRENQLTLTTAESCTGGMVSSRIVSVPGASEMFREGFITYSNKAKRRYLGVKKSTLLKYGAVSEQTAREMAMGACDNTKSDASVAVTGIAGPDGGTEDKPVGLVYIGVCVCGSVTVGEYRFSGSREKIRQTATASALVMLRRCLLDYFSQVTFGKEKKKKR